MTISSNNKYTNMQRDYYSSTGEEWSYDNRDLIVGSFDQHNQWKDYECLLKGIESKDKVALDFGCGPGRAIVLYKDRFKRIDGADISESLLEKGAKYIKDNVKGLCHLYLVDGISLNGVKGGVYDVVFSTITLQHICVHEIRYNLMKEIYRVLKPEGWFTAQMGYGGKDHAVGYYENYYDATGTNSSCDTRVEDADYLKKDLEKIGFNNFEHKIGRTGPGDIHSNWIYFRGQK